VYWVAGLTLVGKVFFLPWLLNRLVRRIQISQEIEPLLNATASMLLCGGFTLLGYIVARPFTSLERLGNNTLAIAVTLLLMVARRAGEGERHVRSQAWTGWRPTHMLGTKVSGKTLGLIGMGRIAKAVARRAHHGFGMKVVFHDPYPPKPEEAKSLGAEPRESIDAVLAEADFVSMHCPATPETRHLMNAQRLGQMKKGAFLINTARGDVVDEAALATALKQGKIAGAGLDVFEKEPTVTADLLTLENVVLFPHLGSATTETRVAMGMRALENLKLFFAGQPVRDRVV
jgi:lactate dehydrogenase-like 2-hydroxyacid dehydrogenase